MHPRRGQAPGFGGRGYGDEEGGYHQGPPRGGFYPDDPSSAGRGHNRGGRGRRGGGPARGGFPSQDWRSEGRQASGGYGEHQQGAPHYGESGGPHYGGSGPSGGGGYQGGDAWGGSRVGSGPSGGGYQGGDIWGESRGGGRGRGYGGRGDPAERGYGGQPSESYFAGQAFQGRGRRGGRGGRGGDGGRHGTSGRGQHASSSSSSGLQGSWASPTPPMSVLLPGVRDLSLETMGPSTSHGEEIAASASDADAPVEAEAPAAQDAADIDIPSTSQSILEAPKRPQAGKLGSKAVVRVNHFLVMLKPNASIHHYDVDIDPKVTSRAVARRLQRQLLEMYQADFQGKLPVYDGSKSLYTAGPLPFTNREFSVVFANENREKSFKVTIRHVSTLKSSVLSEFLQGRRVQAPQENVQALDVALREALTYIYTPVGRSFFTRDLGSAALDGGLIACNGFFQSLRPTAQGLVLNVDLATTAFYESLPVIDFLKQKFRQFDPQRRLNDAVRALVRKSLGRLKVEVTHRQTPRKYRIYGLSPLATKDLKFTVEGGAEIGIIEYFRNTYNYQIRYPELPCLQVQANRTSYLPMEVCKISEGQKYVGKLIDAQTTGLRRLACVRPRDRETKIKSIMASRTGPGRGEFVSSFGMEICPNFTEVAARILNPPKLKYGMQSKVQEIQPRFGSWNLNSSCVVEGSTVNFWALISFDYSFYPNMADAFISGLAGRCHELGMRMSPRTVIPAYFGRREDLESSRLENRLRTVCAQASQAITAMNPQGSLQLLVCLMGEKHSSYGELKRLCETQLGVVSQCCLTKHAKNPNSQYLANVALKINAKMGGGNNKLALELPRMCPIFVKPAIFFGADVTHPNPGDDASPSIAAVVANMDWPSAIKYVASVRAQAHREEIITSLRDMVLELWRKFYDRTKVRPECIIMFRDGVSEGQFDRVLQCEVHAMKEAMRAVGGPDYNPTITWVVVQKRHHTRIFPADTNQDKNGNIFPGTVVDTIITHPREYDFYLCSHAGIQGTSKPTHYHVLWDENGFASDDLQGLINNLCYTYARCTKSVSIVPPAYYAHLAAYRARLYIEAQGGSDTASHTSGQPSSVGSGGRTTRAVAPAVRPLPQIQRNLQDLMYFC